MANNTMELDFTGVSSSSYIPEGIHSVVISGASFTKASTNSDQLEVVFQTADGAIRKAWFSLVPQALWKLKGFLETVGIPCEGKISLNPKSLVRKTCQITVEPDINDPTRLIISRFSRLANSAPEGVYPSAPIVTQPQPPTMPPQANFPPQAGNNAIPPQMMTSPSETQSVEQPEVAPAPAQAPNPAPQGNLPPWMKPAQSTSVSQGNLPPWMKQ